MDPNEVIDFKGETFMEILLVDYRWVIVCFLLLPLSFLYNLWFYTRNKIIFHLNSAPRAHNEKVRKIQKQVILFFFLVRLFGVDFEMCYSVCVKSIGRSNSNCFSIFA